MDLPFNADGFIILPESYYRRRESPQKRLARKLASERGWLVTHISWTPLRKPRPASDEYGDEPADIERGDWKLDGGWLIWLADPNGGEELIEAYQYEHLLEAIERLPEVSR